MVAGQRARDRSGQQRDADIFGRDYWNRPIKSAGVANFKKGGADLQKVAFLIPYIDATDELQERGAEGHWVVR
jgi:hypothetical protein